MSDLENYLQKTFGDNENFKIIELSVKSGDYKSFRVDVRPELQNDILNPQNWAKDIVIKKI